jgi:hypothetical protein
MVQSDDLDPCHQRVEHLRLNFKFDRATCDESSENDKNAQVTNGYGEELHP